MVKFKRRDSDKLSENFGIPAHEFEALASVWEEAQEAINRVIKEGFSKPHGQYEGRDGIMFDATKALETFFKHFDTQEKQDCALIQFVSMDIQQRAESAVRYAAREQFERMLKGMTGGVQDELSGSSDADEDIDDIL